MGRMGVGGIRVYLHGYLQTHEESECISTGAGRCTKKLYSGARETERGMPSGGKGRKRAQERLLHVSGVLTHGCARPLTNVTQATATVMPQGFLNFSLAGPSLGVEVAGVTLTSCWETTRAFPASADYRFWVAAGHGRPGPMPGCSAGRTGSPRTTLYTPRLDSPWQVPARETTPAGLAKGCPCPPPGKGHRIGPARQPARCLHASQLSCGTNLSDFGASQPVVCLQQERI